MEAHLPLTLLSLLALAGCGAKDTSFEYGESGWDDYEADADVDADPPSDEDGWSDTGDADYGGETEENYVMLAPAATAAYVFVANPDRDTVSRISVPSLEVVTTIVGAEPNLVVTTSDYTKAITFNTGSDDLSIIDAESLDVTNVGVRSNLNAMEVSPDGVWAVCYHDADRTDTEFDDEGGSQSFNEISLVNTDTFEHHQMVVGQNPRQVKFTPDSRLALVVSDEALAYLDLTQEDPQPQMIELTDDPLNPLEAEEVEIAPNGAFAFLRQYGATDILIVDLVSQEVGSVEVGTNPTDLDISPDGATAVVVARASKELWLLSTADPYQSPEVVDLPEDEVLGSVLMSPDGTKGILYTTAALTDHYAVWDVATDTVTPRSLVKPVQAMEVSPTGGTLLVFHTKENAEGADPESEYYNAWALTLISLDDFRSNPLRLDAEPTAFAQSADGQYGFFIMEGSKWLEALNYETLIPKDVELKSVPNFVGTLPYTTFAYASQEHSLGRISFYDTADQSLQTITGFELNSEIEH